MKTENINKSLVQIQQSLTKMNSAREQVEKVTKTGAEFTSATSDLVKQVKQMADVVKNENSSVIQSFSNSLADFEKKVHNSIVNGDQSITQKVESFKETTKRLEAYTDAELKNIYTQSSALFKKYQTDLSASINSVVINFSNKLLQFEEKIERTTEASKNGIVKKIEDFNTALTELQTISNSSINEAKLLASETIKNQESEITTAIDTMVSNFSNKLVQFETTIERITEKSQYSHLKEIQNFNTSITELKSTNTKSINEVKEIAFQTIEKQATQSEDIIKTLFAYSEKVQRLVQQLSDTNFSNELEKLSNDVAGLHNDNLTIRKEIQQMEKNVSDILTKSMQQQETLFKKQQKNAYVTWALILLSAGAVTVMCNFL